MFIPDPDLDFFTHPGSPDAGVKKGTGSRIRIRNTGLKWCLLSVKGFLSGLQEVERVLDEASPVGARSRDDPLA